MSEQSLVDTAEFPRPRFGQHESQTISSLVEVDFGGLSDQGHVRANNEDTFLIARFDRTMHALKTNLPSDTYPVCSTETSYGMVVADGMGGHAAGEVASRTAVQVLLDLVLQTPDWIMRLDNVSSDRVVHRLQERVHQIQGAFLEKTQADASLIGMGTTLTLAASLGTDLLVAHVGDSRAYLMREGRLQRLTRDQTLAQGMLDAGLITPEAAAKHTLRHVLTGVLSANEKTVPLEVAWFKLVDGDQVLVCSDGLTEMVTEAAVTEALNHSGPATEICQTLIDLALKAGGKDNVTVVLARYRIPEIAGPV
jgi:serine/threonine protein phosphatase PrpC